MADLVRRRLPAVVAAVVALVLLRAPTAEAGFTGIEEPEGPPPPVVSDGSQVTVELVVRRGDVLVPRVSGGGGSGGGSAPVCTYRLVEIPHGADAFYAVGAPPTPDAVPYWLYCGGALVRALWISPAEVVDVDDVVRGEAARYVETVLGPGLSVGVSPPTFAVTGIPTWNWVEGWDGAPIAVAPINPFGDSIEITLRLASVRWDFGDGTVPVVGDLGRAHPEESSVQHTYTDRSTTVERPDGAYAVSATVTIGVSYRVNGGPEVAVDPPLTTTVTSPVIVRQVQAVLD